ncbi:DNA-3-methyladenine glycosylase family protein [Deinococcus roseus]|uniref:DNA-3-methyladenine glycosylase II n=1 Tax=Deinococcus roseus TaxID=392414 RepID=A0ABQ2D4Q0_9DEIO|nr:DNA-3-methyladenine glycosylase [Deinococcus roseus]GGJ44840.1 DNA-3-methyladenine glycosidase [Deinococcus roseus]
MSKTKTIMEHLSLDPILGTVIEKVGPPPEVLKSRHDRPFTVLASSVIGQQLSGKAADAIEKRVVALTGGLLPELLVPHTVEALRACGLSNAKARTLHALSTAVLDGRVNFDALEPLSNEEIIEQLLPIWGIGRWTVEMFLMFGLGREDIYSLGDGALKRAFSNLYGESSLDEVTGRWSPYRSYASWYLWRTL